MTSQTDKKMIPVMESPLATCFLGGTRGSEALENIFYLGEEEAMRVWQRYIDQSARGLYQLPPDSWLNRAKWAVIGHWLAAYNGEEDDTNVLNFVAEKSGWALNEPLLLIQGGLEIVSLPLYQFRKYWKGLMEGFDDGPLLMAAGDIRKQVFCFTPIGTIQYWNESMGSKEKGSAD